MNLALLLLALSTADGAAGSSIGAVAASLGAFFAMEEYRKHDPCPASLNLEGPRCWRDVAPFAAFPVGAALGASLGAVIGVAALLWSWRADSEESKTVLLF